MFALKEMRGYVLALSIGIETSRMTFKSCSSILAIVLLRSASYFSKSKSAYL